MLRGDTNGPARVRRPRTHNGRLGDRYPDPVPSDYQALRAASDGDRLRRLTARWVDAGDSAIAAVRDPDRAGADGHTGR